MKALPWQPSLFEDQRLDLEGAITLSLTSLREYGQRYRHWAAAYSGGKDSTAMVTFTAWAIRQGLVPVPESFTVMYADTRLELAPLHAGALALMDTLGGQGFGTQVVLPAIDDRFLVYMLGYGVPPASNTFRWCTDKIKIQPMYAALDTLRAEAGEKFLMLTGVRMGESAVRDQRIAVSCSKDSGECGQGWFQTSTPETVADTLAPLLHWRLCHVYNWLYDDGSLGHGYDVRGVAEVYGLEEVRTGCVGCPLASHDTALERLLHNEEWAHLHPLLELKPLWKELKHARWRKRKARPELRKDGKYGKNVQRKGPLTMEGRAYGLERVLNIQRQAGINLINAEEESRIREMWALDMWPEKWSADDVNADVMLPALSLTIDGRVAEQQLLFGN